MLLIFPSVTSRNEFPGKCDPNDQIHEELDQSEEANLLHGGWVWLFGPDFLAFRNLLVAFLLPLEPSLVRCLLFLPVFGVSRGTHAIMKRKQVECKLQAYARKGVLADFLVTFLPL